jgi:hypothetical protein
MQSCRYSQWAILPVPKKSDLVSDCDTSCEEVVMEFYNEKIESRLLATT